MFFGRGVNTLFVLRPAADGIMKFVIVPVKDLSQAKNRLSSLLPQEVRTDIAYAMLEDVLNALGAARLPDRKLVVTMDKRAAEIARGLGIEHQILLRPIGDDSARIEAAGLLGGY